MDAAAVSPGRATMISGHRENAEVGQRNSWWSYMTPNLGSCIVAGSTLVGWPYQGDVYRVTPKLPSLDLLDLDPTQLEAICDALFCIEPSITPQYAVNGELRVLPHTMLATTLMYIRDVEAVCSYPTSKNTMIERMKSAFVNAGMFGEAIVLRELRALGDRIMTSYIAGNARLLGGMYDGDQLKKNTDVIAMLGGRVQSLEAEMSADRAQHREAMKLMNQSFQALAESNARIEAALRSFAPADSKSPHRSGAASSARSSIGAPEAAPSPAVASSGTSSLSVAPSPSPLAGPPPSAALSVVGAIPATILSHAPKLKVDVGVSLGFLLSGLARSGITEVSRGTLLSRTDLTESEADRLVKVVKYLRAAASDKQLSEWTSIRVPTASSLMAIIAAIDIHLRNVLRQGGKDALEQATTGSTEAEAEKQRLHLQGGQDLTDARKKCAALNRAKKALGEDDEGNKIVFRLELPLTMYALDEKIRLLKDNSTQEWNFERVRIEAVALRSKSAPAIESSSSSSSSSVSTASKRTASPATLPKPKAARTVDHQQSSVRSAASGSAAAAAINGGLMLSGSQASQVSAAASSASSSVAAQSVAAPLSVYVSGRAWAAASAAAGAAVSFFSSSPK